MFLTTEAQQNLCVFVCSAEFEQKYEQQNQLGEGGCGSVFAGYRRADHLPVAIKHIERDKVFCTQVVSVSISALSDSTSDG